MKRIQGIVIAGAMLLAGAARATPPVMSQEESREAAVQQNRGAAYVDLSACGAADRKVQDQQQVVATLQLASGDRGPVTSAGPCSVRSTRQVVARVDDRLRR